MKKNCNGCKALESHSTGMPWRCILGHPIESAEKLWGLTVTYKPLEECEKPKTLKELCAIAPKHIQRNIAPTIFTGNKEENKNEP